MNTTDRVSALVKAAGLRIVPASHYTRGKARDITEAAIKKLKEPKGFAGADLSTRSTKFFKEASDRSKEVGKDALITAAGAANGGALGYVARADMANNRIKNHDARKGFSAMKSGSPIEKNLADSAKRVRRMKPAVGRLARRAGAVGALAGAALGALSMKKEAAAKPVVHKGQHLLPKGAQIPAGAKDVSPKAVLKSRAGKAGKVLVAVTGAAALAGAAKHRLEKKASQKDGKGHLSVGGAVTAGAGYAAARRYSIDGLKAIAGLKAQAKYIRDKGGRIAPIDVRMAMDSFKKPLARRVGKAALKGGALAGAAAAGVNKLMDNHKAKARKAARMQKQAETVGSQGSKEMKKLVNSNGKKGHMALQPGADKKPVKTPTKSKNPLAKQAAEMIVRDGVKHRKGTPGSAAATMAGIATGLTAGNNIAAYRVAKKHALGEVISRRSILKNVPQQAALNAAYGYAFGKIRGHFRKKRGEVDTSPAAFAKLKAGK